MHKKMRRGETESKKRLEIEKKRRNARKLLQKGKLKPVNLIERSGLNKKAVKRRI